MNKSHKYFFELVFYLLLFAVIFFPKIFPIEFPGFHSSTIIVNNIGSSFVELVLIFILISYIFMFYNFTLAMIYRILKGKVDIADAYKYRGKHHLLRLIGTYTIIGVIVVSILLFDIFSTFISVNYN